MQGRKIKKKQRFNNKGNLEQKVNKNINQNNFSHYGYENISLFKA